MLLFDRDGNVATTQIVGRWYRTLAVDQAAGQILVQKSYERAQVMLIQKNAASVAGFSPFFLNGLGSSVLISSGKNVIFAGALSPASPAGHLHKTSLSGSLDPVWESAAVQKIGNVSAAAVDPSGRLYVAGLVSTDDAFRTQDLVRLTSTGDRDPTFPTARLLSAWGLAASTLLPLPNGQLLVGGSFDEIAGAPRNKLARLNADGQVDQSFDPGTVLLDYFSFVDAICVQRDGGVLVGGRNQGASSVAVLRLRPDASLDTNFTLIPSWSETHRIIEDSAGKILIAGDFQADAQRNGIARLNPDGTVDLSFKSQPGNARTGYATINDVLLHPDGKLVVAGAFDTLNGSDATGIARLNADGSLDTSFSFPAEPPDGAITKLVISADGSIFLTGDFSRINAAERLGLAKLTPLPTLTAHTWDSVGGFHFSVSAGTGKRVRIESSTDLRSWKILGSYAPSNWPLEIIHASSPDPIQFYRARED